MPQVTILRSFGELDLCDQLGSRTEYEIELISPFTKPCPLSVAPNMDRALLSASREV